MESTWKLLLYPSANILVLIRNLSIWSYQCGQLILNVFLQEGIKINSGLDAVWLLQHNCKLVICVSSLYKNGSNKVKNTIKIEHCWNTSDVFFLMQLQVSTKKGTWRGMDSINKLCRYFQNLRYIPVRISCIYPK